MNSFSGWIYTNGQYLYTPHRCNEFKSQVKEHPRSKFVPAFLSILIYTFCRFITSQSFHRLGSYRAWIYTWTSLTYCTPLRWVQRSGSEGIRGQYLYMPFYQYRVFHFSGINIFECFYLLDMHVSTETLLAYTLLWARNLFQRFSTIFYCLNLFGHTLSHVACTLLKADSCSYFETLFLDAKADGLVRCYHDLFECIVSYFFAKLF